MSKRRNHSATFKAQVALAALSGEKTLAQLTAEFGVHQTLICKWQKQLKDSATDVFAGRCASRETASEKELIALRAKIGELTMERDFLANAWRKR
jgi:transposase